MPLDSTMIFYALIAVIVLFAVLVIHLEIRVHRLLHGKDAKTLEDTIIGLTKETEVLNKSRGEIENYLGQVETRLRRAVSGVATIRFNPFKGSSGSNQSFATAFVDERGNGVVLSSLYSRDRVSVYAKPLAKGASEYELTAEEKQAIAKTKE